MKISKRFTDRAKASLRRYQNVLKSARVRDVNESDTVVIVNDLLTDVLGYDKYEEITTEFAIRGTYCDLAIKHAGSIRYLIEVKAVGKDLRENHLRQVVDYGATEGVDYVVLTNGVLWQVHKIRFEKPVGTDLVVEFDLLASKASELLPSLFLISKEALSQHAIDAFQRRSEATNRFTLAQVTLSDAVVKVIRRELRRVAPGLKITADEIADRLKSEVLKREVVDGGQADEARKWVRRALRKLDRKGARSRQAPPSENTKSGEGV